MLKKIFSILFLILTTLFFIGCSKDAIDEWNNTVSGIDPDSKITMKINDISYQEDSSSDGLTWDKIANGNGTYDYSINGYIQEKPYTIWWPKTLKLKLGTKIQSGQIINGNTTGFNFVIYGNGLNESEYRFVNGTSKGQIKITSFDGITMSGEFSFTEIVHFSDRPVSNYKNNTISGSFNSLVKDK